jgi:hypothetical protein
VIAGAASGLLGATLSWSIVIAVLVAVGVFSAFGVVLGRIGRRGLAPIVTRYPRNNPN